MPRLFIYWGNSACVYRADPDRFFGGKFELFWLFPSDSNQEGFLLWPLSLTKFTEHPGFVPDAGLAAGKS